MSTLLTDLHDAGFFSPLAYRFAESLGRIVPDSPPEVLAAAALAVHQTEAGHVCAHLLAFAGRPVRLTEGGTVEGCRWPPLKRWQRRLQESAAVSGGDATPMVLDAAGRLYLQRYFCYQMRLADWIRDRSARVADDIDEPSLFAGLTRLFGDSEESVAAREAAEIAIRRPFAVISGGPGTGKTTIVMRILALLVEQWLATGRGAPTIMALAPTGKAAQRLGEVMGQMVTAVTNQPDISAALPREAQTVHRLLARYAARPARALERTAPPTVPADVVVLDEASMVDLALMHELTTRLRPSARLILLGDKDQLASVASGSVLADICEAAAEGGAVAAATARLTTSHRFDARSGIGNLARAVNAGDAEGALGVLRGDPSREVVFVAAADPEGVRRALAPLVATYYEAALQAREPAEAMARFSRFRILTAHRSGDTGQSGLNRFVEGALSKRGALTLTGPWYPGRPVMVTRNDYQLDLFNGDIGLVWQPPGREALRVVFPDSGGGQRWILPARLQGTDTAFAMTVHRAQGSEFEHVAVVMPEKPSPITVRELLYTACTRARRRLTVISSEGVLRHAIATPTERASGLTDRLLER